MWLFEVLVDGNTTFHYSADVRSSKFTTFDVFRNAPLSLKFLDNPMSNFNTVAPIINTERKHGALHRLLATAVICGYQLTMLTTTTISLLLSFKSTFATYRWNIVKSDVRSSNPFPQKASVFGKTASQRPADRKPCSLFSTL